MTFLIAELSGGLTGTEMNYKTDRAIEDKFSKIIKAILGNYFFVKDIEMDTKQGTDFLTYTIKPFKVAVRLRRFPMFLKYPNDFTIRWSRPSGIKTEIHKINEGLVDYILYGFIDEKENKIIKYFIGCLSVFRESHVPPIVILTNTPPDSKLAVYKISQFPSNFVKFAYKQN